MKNMKTIKAKWAAKILRSKHFVVMTDKESVICFQGVDPNNIEDFIVLAAQAGELTDMRDKLNTLIKQHDVAAKKLGGHSASTIKRKSTKANKATNKSGKTPKRI